MYWQCDALTHCAQIVSADGFASPQLGHKCLWHSRLDVALLVACTTACPAHLPLLLVYSHRPLAFSAMRWEIIGSDDRLRLCVSPAAVEGARGEMGLSLCAARALVSTLVSPLIRGPQKEIEREWGLELLSAFSAGSSYVSLS